MITNLDEIVTLTAVIDSAGGTEEVQFQLQSRYAEIMPVFEAYANNKAVLEHDTDRSPLTVKIYDSNNRNYVRTAAGIFVVNSYFRMEDSKPFLIGSSTYTFEFKHDDTVSTAIPVDIEPPFTVKAQLYVCYLSREEYEQRMAARPDYTKPE